MRFINLKTRVETSSIDVPTVLCIGDFDGVHLGHRQLVASVLENHKKLKKLHPSLVSGAWFFNSNSYKAAREIYTIDEKLNVFASLGIDYAIIADFEKQYMFVIDVYSVYKYTIADNKIVKIFDLDGLINNDDIITRIKNFI